MVLFMGGEMLDEDIDPLGDEGDLDLRRARIMGVRLVVPDDLGFHFFAEHAYFLLFFALNDNRTGGKCKSLFFSPVKGRRGFAPGREGERISGEQGLFSKEELLGIFGGQASLFFHDLGQFGLYLFESHDVDLLCFGSGIPGGLGLALSRLLGFFTFGHDSILSNSLQFNRKTHPWQAGSTILGF
jgi:hypothetical protein